MTSASMKTAVMTALLCAGLAMPGCYKAEAEAQKTRANQAEERIKSLEAELNTAKSGAQAAAGKAQQAEATLRSMATGAVLVTMVDGQPIGTDTIRFNGSSFVRHGERRRGNGSVQFDNGKVADGPMTANRDNGKKWFEGAVKNSRPDGEWIWYDRDGKASTRETWRDGKLADVSKGSTGKDGQTSWTKMTKADRDAWIRSTANTFINLPEFIRDTSSATAAAGSVVEDPGTTSPGSKPASTKPAPKPASKPAAKPAGRSSSR